MKRSAVALCLSMAPIAAFLFAVDTRRGKACDLPTVSDDRMCPCPWMGCDSQSSAWHASGICGTIAADSYSNNLHANAARDTCTLEQAGATNPKTGHPCGAVRSSIRVSHTAGSLADQRSSASSGGVDAVGCPPDFLYVYSPCDFEDKPVSIGGDSLQPEVVARPAASGYEYWVDPRLLDYGVWHNPLAWLYSAAASATKSAAPTVEMTERGAIQGDLSWLVEQCQCDLRHDLGLRINLENDGIGAATSPAADTIAEQRATSDLAPQRSDYELVIDGPDRFLYVRRPDGDLETEALAAVGRSVARSVDEPRAAAASGEAPPQLVDSFATLLRAMGQLALEASRTLDDLQHDIASRRSSDEGTARTAASAKNRSAARQPRPQSL